MKNFLAVALAAAALGAFLFPSGARAVEEEIRLKIINNQAYDLVLESRKLSGCGQEEFIIPPVDVPSDDSRVMRWSGGCDVSLTWSVRYFTGIEVRVHFDAEDGELKARSDSDEFHPSVLGPRCEDGVCDYRVLIYNAEPWWD